MELIISIDRFRELTGISDAYNEGYIAPFIERATDIIAEQILGTALTTKLITDFNSDTLAGLYLTMYNSRECSIEKMVAWTAYKSSLYRMSVRISNTGISDGSGSPDGNAVSTQRLADLQNECEAAAMEYTNRVKNFLQLKYNDIPELKDNTPEFLKPDLHKSNSWTINASPNNVYNDI